MTNATTLASHSTPVVRNLATRNQLVESHIYLVHAAAGRMKKSYGRYLTMDELIGYGTEGLIDAADRFDPDRGVSFPTFSFYRIRGAILDGLRRSGWYSRYDIARFHAAKLRAEQHVNELLEEHLTDASASVKGSVEDNLRGIEDTLSQIATIRILSLDYIQSLADEDGDACRETPFINQHSSLAADEATPAPDEARDLRALGDRLRRAVATLPQRERLVIEMHYFADQDLHEVGAALGVRKWTTSRLHARAVRLLRDALSDLEPSA